MPLRTCAILAGVALLFLVLGRLLLPLAVLVAVAAAVVLWYAPEIAYWADDALQLHRLPGLGGDNRQMAVASFAALALLAVVGNVALAGLGQKGEPGAATVQAVPRAAPTSAVPAALAPEPAPAATSPPPTATTLPTLTAPLPDSQARPALAESPAQPPASVQRSAPAPAAPATAAPIVRAAAPVVAAPPTAAAAAPSSARPRPTVAAATRAPATAVPNSGELRADIAGLTSAASAGGRMTLQARTAPGAACELSVQYKDGVGQSPAAQKAGDDGICAWTWNVPAATPSGAGTATLVVKQGGKSQRRTASFSVN